MVALWAITPNVGDTVTVNEKKRKFLAQFQWDVSLDPAALNRVKGCLDNRESLNYAFRGGGVVSLLKNYFYEVSRVISTLLFGGSQRLVD